ncbi:MAG: glycosyltransferase family 4 protein [Lachnospiraceae bacterium]|nr:glycosyltransferase family 4 protein [Lachnospiraceae bacterium]
MKILHITATHLNQEGGIPAVLKNLVKYQNEISGMCSRVLAIKKKTAHIDAMYFDYIAENNSIDKYISDYSPDIVIIHSVYFLKYYFIEKMLRKKNIPYFIEPHGSFGNAAQEKSQWKKRVVNNTILHSFIKRAGGYIFLNEEEKRDSVFKKNDDLIIPNGIEQVVKINREAKLSESEKGELFLYFIGRFDITHKGIDILFDALEIIDKKRENIHITFFGKGNMEEEEYLDNRIEKLHFIDIKKFGPIYGKEKEQFLCKYDAMILTSRYEGFPMTVLEALSYGVPCLVTKGTNVGAMIQNENLGYLLGDTPKEVAQGISNFKKEYMEQGQNYGVRIQHYMKENYLWSKIAKESYDMFCAFLK